MFWRMPVTIGSANSIGIGAADGYEALVQHGRYEVDETLLRRERRRVRLVDRLDDTGQHHVAAIGEGAVADGELHRRRRQQALADRQVDHVAEENPWFLALGQHTALDEVLLRLVIGDAAVELVGQVDAGFRTEAEVADLVLQQQVIRSPELTKNCSPRR